MLRKNLFFIFVLLFSCIISAQSSIDENSESFTANRKNNNIEIRFGLMSKFSSGSNINIGGVSGKYESKGLLGAISYSRWVQNDLALTVYGGMLNANAQTRINLGTVNTESAAVILLLFGIKYEPIDLNPSNNIRPYITVLAGPLFGYASNVLINNSVGVQSLSESAFSAFLGAGVDFSLNRLFMFGIRGGYYLATDFSNRIGYEKNYSSPEFSASFGIQF
ncbi:MAG: hypothetical protein WB779_04085 [Ignavibacteriaceae bacterium]